MKNNQTNRHKNPLFMRLIALALTCAMAISASNVSAFAADVLGDSSAYSSADASVDVSTGDSSSDPADSTGDSSGTTSADASDSSSGSGESTGAEDASAGEEENATEDTGDPADEAEGDESAADESAEAEAEADAQVSAMAPGDQNPGQDQGGGQQESATTGNANHIDIGVSASASVTVNGVVYSNSNIGISSSDFTSGNVTITAVQGTTALTGSTSSSDWSRTGNSGDYTYTITNSNVDFVYNLSDLSSSSGSSGITQVRIGGCFPVGTSSNQVNYTLKLKKTVTLTAENGDTLNVSVTLTATFGYWDEDNDCPGLSGNWSSGYFSSGSGLDFVLKATLVNVVKIVQDSDGNLISEASGQSFGYALTTSGTSGGTETGTITVGSDGIGMVTLDVDNNSISSVTETSYPATITTSDGTYSYVKTETSIDSSTNTATIVNVYDIETTDIPVEKVWSDDDYNGYRPDEIVVTLLANGEAAEDDDGNTITLTLNDANSWKGTFSELPLYDDSGKAITYTIAENTVAGYTSAISGDATNGYTITNTLETGSLTLNKVVKADSSIDTSAYTFTFYVAGNNGELDKVTSVTDGTKDYSVSGGVATVTVSAGSSVTLIDLPVGSYTVYETSGTTVTANGHTWTVSGDNGATKTVTADTTASATITNTITGSAVVSITKNWEDSSNYWSTRPTNDGSTFAVTLTATGTNGESYQYTTTATWTEGTNIWTLDLSGVTAYDTEGNMLTYTVTETEVEGYVLTDDTITVTPASDRNVSLTNKLLTATVTVTKTVLDSDGNVVSSTENDDDFRFALYDTDTLTSYGTETLTAGQSKSFTVPLGTYSLTEYLVGSHDHSYDTTVTVDGVETTVTETFDSTAGVKYHTVTFTLDEDDADKNIAVSVTNQEEEISVDLATLVNGSKTLESDNDVTKTFTYTVKEASIVNGVETEGATVATGTATVSNGETVAIEWTVLNQDAFTYDEVGTYYYVIYEDVATGTGTGGVVYDATRYTLTITVTKDENGGGLIATASMTMNVQNEDGTRTTTTVKSDKNADSFTAATTDASSTASDSFTASFTNTYNATETSIILRASKVLTGRTLKEGEFSIVVQELDEYGNAIGEAVTRSNGATGQFGYEIVYDEAGTYIYKVSEEQGDLVGVDYDGHYYIVYVYVEDQDGVLTVTGTEVGYYDADDNAIIGTTFSFDSMTFTNTYTAEGSGSLSTYKVMEGRTFNAGETFTFTITALDSAAPTLTDPGNGVEFKDNGDGTYTVTVTVPSSAAGDSILNEVLASFDVDQDDVGEWVYRVSETSASVTNGMTLDSATYGHLITVYVTDDGDGTMTVTTESTNDTDWNGDGETDTTSSVIVNTYNSGIKTIYGTKVWVDGGLSHDNSSEVTLTLFYSTNGKTWYNYTDDYTVTWGTANTSDWHIAGLPIYDESSNKLYYQVVETYTNGNSYTTTYGADESSDPETIPEDNSSTNRYTITNTIKQDEVSISGTKTWVEPTETEHENAAELVLTVSRNSDGTSLTNLTQEDGNGTGVDGTYIVAWTGDTYNVYWYYDEDAQTYVGLPLYDASGYTYSYRVVESYAAAYEETYADYEEDDAVFTYISDTEVTFDFTNRAPDDTEEDPTKTEDGTGTEATVNGQTVVEYGEVAVGDTITYTISYYNNANTTATVRITDPLDSGVDYVSSDPTGTYNESTHTVTWEIETEAFTHGSVTVTVQVNSSARTLVSGETAATVDNQATVYNTETANTGYTEIVTNPLEDDEDETTEKGIISVTYEDEEGNEYTRTETDGTNVYVYEGDQIHYIISRYNNTNESATIMIVDTLDEGVTYTYSSVGSTYYADATTVNGVDIPARSVVWIVTTNPYSYATVQMTVTVNSSAKTATQTYDAGVPGTYSTSDTVAEYTDYTYGTTNTTASVANQAVAYTVGNDVVSYSNVFENPLGEDEETDPVKSEPYREVTEDTTDTDNTVTYEAVAVSEVVEYKIDYYNNHNTQATITIVDELDEDVTFRSASDSGVYDSGTHTVTWTLTVAPLTSGSVTAQVQVLSSAVSDDPTEPNTISNQADVYNSEDDDPTNAHSTNIVVNPVDDDPGDPMKEVADDSAAGVDGDNVQVGDEITYEITYYNHNSEAATITIVDTLDPNVELVDATDSEGNSLYATPVAGAVAKFVDNLNGTVTWTFTAEAYETGIVTITVRVKDGAQGGIVSNQASVQVGNDAAKDTNISENPVDEDPVDPVKTETTINDTETAEPTVDGNTYTYEEVAVSDTITYTISYYNHYGAAADVTITDILDSGVTYVSSSDNGTYNSYTRTVTWTIADVPAYTEGTVTLTVQVNSSAKNITYGETEATVDNQATVTITEGEDSVENTTNIVVNPLEDDDPTDPTKTELTVLDNSTGNTKWVGNSGTTGAYGDITYGEVGVGDEITYRISYTNHMNGIATITITDKLDEGVDFVSASDDGAYDEDTHTVTWTIENVNPYGTGTVTLTVKVNENAKTTEADETEATVENQATETNSLVPDNEYETNVVINPLEDDEPETPTKTLTSVTDESGSAQEATDAYGNRYVSVGDTVTYSITYYNNLNEVANVVIEDVLDEGVDFVSLTDENGDVLEGARYIDTTHTVTYTAKDVAPLTGGTVYLTVIVNENAKASENTYTVNRNADSDYSLTYGVDDTTASIANQASTTVVSATIGNQTTYYSEVVENPLEEDEPTEPEKTETEIANVETTEPKVEGNTYTYETVGVGEVIEYEISYYNNHNTQATITITDTLDEGVTYVEDSASDGGEYNEGTITWELTVEPLTAGTVSFQVMVNETAKTVDEGETVADVDNQATVVVNDGTGTENTYETNIVVNPIDPDDEVEPEKTVGTRSDAGVDSANVNVGDQITYIITYYNHTNETATVTIEDVLDEGFTFVEAPKGTYDESTHTVNWTIEDVDPYTGGFVRLIVEVNDKALVKNVVTNDADVTIGDNEYTTDMTSNPVNDEPEAPEKELTSVTYADETDEDTLDEYDNLYVHVGDTVTYSVTYYNNLNEVADVIIMDELDEGVDFVSLTDENGNVLTEADGVYSAHEVTYTVEDVPALSGGTVYLTVTVNENAKLSTNTYVTNGESLTYGVGDNTTASIANQASTTVVSATVGNQATYYSNVVENPLEEETPTEPVKTETEIEKEEVTPDISEDGESYEYDSVSVGDTITYTIEYYNHHNTEATITIEDVLEDGLTVIESSISDKGTYDEATRTITWVLNVEPLTEGTVSFQAVVNENAKTINTATETVATVDNDAVMINSEDTDTGHEYSTNIVTNPIEPEEPVEPLKTVTSETGADGANLNLGDKITYTITYYNHTNTMGTVTIEDALDSGVDYVSSDPTGTYDDAAHTVTWDIENVEPYTGGTVELTVAVNENALVVNQVDNKAVVHIGGNEYTTKVTSNLVNDEPEAPTKELTSVTYAEESTEAAYDGDNLYVHVGDALTYTIDYYNNLNEVATVTIVDVLDEGVTFQSATGVEKDDATEDDTITYELTEDEDGTVTVTWTVADVAALTGDTVELTVIVNENAETAEQTYSATDPTTGGDYTAYQYTTTASIANQASTEVVSATVTNQGTYYSSVVENPLEDEDPIEPVKTAETVEEETVEPTVSEDGNTVTYDTVGVGETVTYTISYYNYHNTAATITIVDPLDEGLTVDETSITDDGVYDADAHTITWTLNVEPFTGGTVSFQAMVNEDAKTIDTATETVAAVENQATVTVTDEKGASNDYETNIVVHPIDPEDPSEPQKFVSTSSEAGVSGANVSVGDQITYTITYYNHTNTTADVTIVDTLMDGVTFVSATESDAITYELGEDEDGLVTVTWTVADVAPYSGGTVNLTIEVGDEALTATQVENDADVTIGDNEYTTNLVVNPVDDEPQDPVKTVNVGDGTKVSAGDKLTYTITYYNNLGTAADVTITDELDSDVTYVSSSNGGVYDSDTHTVTWTIEDVEAYTEDSVTLTVKVKSGATGSVNNTASVQIADNDPVDTNEVENPIYTTSSKSSSPKTGDSFQLTLWVLLLAGSAAGLLALYFRRKSSDDAE